MKKTILSIAFISILTSNIYAGTLTISSWGPTDTVTNVALNSRNQAIANVINGGIDNTNVDTINGYRLFKTVAVLPSAGTQGSVYFLTSDNTLNFDTGSNFLKSIGTTTSSPVTGDVLSYTGSAWNSIAAGSANKVLTSNGAGVAPTYQNVSLSNVSGKVALGVHNTSTQSLGATAWTKRTFTTTDLDSGGYWASNTFTPLVAGYYLVTYMDAIAPNSSTVLYRAAIYKNGSSYAQQDRYDITGTTIESFTVSSLVQLNGSTDYIEFYLYNGSGGSSTAQGTGYSYASITRVY